MIINAIEGATRRIGKSQGYLGLRLETLARKWFHLGNPRQQRQMPSRAARQSI